MKQILSIILFVLGFSQIYAQATPAEGLKEIPLTGLSTDDGSAFHFYSVDGKLNRGFSEVYIALTDKDNNFVENFTVSDFRPIMDMGSFKHSTPVGIVEKVDGKALYKTWFSFLMFTGQMGGTWSLSFTYSIGNPTTKSATITTTTKSATASSIATTPNDTITKIGWFKDRHCTGAVSLPLQRSCGIGCGTGAGNMASCWNGGLGVFIYNPNESGQISKAVARSDEHFLLFDAKSKELVRAFLLSLPATASGKLSVKVTGYRVVNGIAANSTESNIPELSPDSVIHRLNAFHLLSIEGVYIDTLTYSYSGFATKTYKYTQADLAPSNISAVNYTGGATVKFTPPANAGNAKSNLTGYKVRVYNKLGEIQDQFTTISNDTTVKAIDIKGLTASGDNTFTVTALYPGSAVEAESNPSNAIEKSFTDITLPVDDYAADSKWLQSFTFKNATYYLSVVNPKSIKIGSQTVKAYINKKDDIIKPYTVVNSGFRVEATPFMRSMGHGSTGNTALVWNTANNDYEGTLNFSMEGDWRVNLRIFDAVADTLIAGTNIDENGDGSTHYWDFYLDKTTSNSTGITDLVSNGISVYPTLSLGEITVNTPAEANIRVINSIGKLIGTYQLAGSKTIELNVPSGLYFVSVESSGKTSVHKVIIRK